MRRLVWILALALTLLLVLRLVVLPLAQQRETRRRQPASTLSLLPAETEDFVLRRNSLRRFPARLWPEGESFPLERAREWGIPVDSLAGQTSLGAFTGGEWMAARSGEQRWLMGPLSRLAKRYSPALSLSEGGEDVLDCAGLLLTARGYFFLAAADEAALDQARGGWLESLPVWSELGDLMVGADLLAYHRQGSDAALFSAKKLDESILMEVMAWGPGDLEAMILEYFPLPDSEGQGPPPDDLPFLRSTAPWDRQGKPLEKVSETYRLEGSLGIAMRQWRGENCLARQHLLDLAGER